MKVGIIVPVYRAERYLKDCLWSILHQSYRDLEIILIDDGSDDGSAWICDSYARKDNRIIVIHKENEGQSIARNEGLHICSCPYVMFVDADDRLAEDAVKNLLEPLKFGDYDIISGCYDCIKNGKKEKVKFPFTDGEWNKRAKNRKRYRNYKTESVFGYVWGKLYKADFLKQHHLAFDDIRKYYMEDTLFNLKAVCHNPHYYISRKIVYHYNIHSNTSSNHRDRNLEQKILNSLTLYTNYLYDQGKAAGQMDLLVPLLGRMFCWAIVGNVPYEGVKYRTIKNKVRLFLRNPAVLRILNEKSIWTALFSISSIPQKIFYFFCLVLLKWNQTIVLSLAFTVLSPFFMIYVRKKFKKE